MSMAETKVSSGSQVTIPSDVRKALGLKPGDKLLLVVRDNHLIVMPKPKSFAKSLRGIARGLYPEDYLQKERDSWA